MTGQNDRQTQILSGQIVILARHCPVTDRYFEPWIRLYTLQHKVLELSGSTKWGNITTINYLQYQMIVAWEIA